MKFSNVRLLVRDYEKCFRFYTEKLGLEAAFDIEGCYGSFKVAEGIEGLAIFTSDLMAPVAGNADKELPAGCRDKMMVSFEVDNVDEAFETLSARGRGVCQPADRHARLGDAGRASERSRRKSDRTFLRLWQRTYDTHTNQTRLRTRRSGRRGCRVLVDKLWPARRAQGCAALRCVGQGDRAQPRTARHGTTPIRRPAGRSFGAGISKSCAARRPCGSLSAASPEMRLLRCCTHLKMRLRIMRSSCRNFSNMP